MSKKIISEIKNKILPLNDFIDHCLYKHKNSYYEKNISFSRNGDFVTSPYISSIFGEMIALYVTNHFIQNQQKKFNLLEIGAGEGILARDIITTLKKLKQINFQYFVYEKSKKLKNIQKENLQFSNIKWINSLSEYKSKTNTFIISNELIDAFPVTQLKKINNIWLEKHVKYNKKYKKFELVLKKTKKNFKNLIKLFDNKLNFIEFAPQTDSFIKKVSMLLKRNSQNAFLTIDYGYCADQFNDSIQSIRKNKKTHFLKNPGDQDITYHVNFKLIKKLFNRYGLKKIFYTTQSSFLKSCGIIERLNQSKKVMMDTKEKSNLEKSVERLLDKKQMGELFKVMIVNSN